MALKQRRSVGKEARYYYTDTGKSQRLVAESFGVPKSTVGEIERRSRPWLPQVANMLWRSFGSF